MGVLLQTSEMRSDKQMSTLLSVLHSLHHGLSSLSLRLFVACVRFRCNPLL